MGSPTAKLFIFKLFIPTVQIFYFFLLFLLLCYFRIDVCLHTKVLAVSASYFARLIKNNYLSNTAVQSKLFIKLLTDFVHARPIERRRKEISFSFFHIHKKFFRKT